MPMPSMAPDERAEIRSLLGLLFVAVGLILAIACGNVANLMLARAAGRSRELAVRLALGATRSTLVRQVLAEMLVLAPASGAVGLAARPLDLRPARPGVAAGDPRNAGARREGVRVCCSGFAGMRPGVRTGAGMGPSSTDIAGAMKQIPAASGLARGRVQRAFAIAQIALSAALVIACGLVLGSIRRIAAIQPGFRPDGVVMATLDLSLLGISPETGTAFFQTLIRGLPPCRAYVPRVWERAARRSIGATAWNSAVSLPTATLWRRDISGRSASGWWRGGISRRPDGAGSAPVAIVSRSLAARLWGGGNAVGRMVRCRRTLASRWMVVVGVAADSRYRSVLHDPRPLLYMPLWQNYDSIARLMVADGRPDAGTFKERLRSEIAAPPAGPAGAAVNTMREQIEQSLWQRRAAATVLSFFGPLALGLACTGIYGVVSYLAAQRTREMGIRMALGAGRATVLRDVIAQAARLTAGGLACAVPLAFWTRPLLARFLYPGAAADTFAFAQVAFLFAAVGLIASLGPAYRAASVDPAITLRGE